MFCKQDIYDNQINNLHFVQNLYGQNTKNYTYFQFHEYQNEKCTMSRGLIFPIVSINVCIAENVLWIFFYWVICLWIKQIFYFSTLLHSTLLLYLR